jgi:hypothetical protein
MSKSQKSFVQNIAGGTIASNYTNRYKKCDRIWSDGYVNLQKFKAYFQFHCL